MQAIDVLGDGVPQDPQPFQLREGEVAVVRGCLGQGRSQCVGSLAAGSQLLVGDKARTGFEIEAASADSIQVRDYPAIECAEATILYACWVGEE